MRLPRSIRESGARRGQRDMMRNFLGVPTAIQLQSAKGVPPVRVPFSEWKLRSLFRRFGAVF